MIINKVWAMPSANTFSIKPINTLISGYVDEVWDGALIMGDEATILDPFSRNSPFSHRCITNDLDTSTNADYHMDALDFLKLMGDNTADMLLFDPPYSPRQVSECYKALEKTVNMQTTQASFWGNLKKEVARVVKDGGIVITCGWNSGGIGKSLGFIQEEILLVAHGGWHNDTIVTVERKGL